MGKRDQFIPVRKSDLVEALLADPRFSPDAERFRQFCRLLASIFHYEYFAELERLKDAYFHFNPEHAGKLNGATARPGSYEELTATLSAVLAKANFTEVPRDEVERAFRATGLVQVEVSTPVEDYRDIRFFRRGQHRESVALSEWYGWRKRTVEADVYDDVVVIAAPKPPEELIGKEQRKRFSQGKIGQGVLIKYFRNIASADLNTLLPSVRVIMRARDKWLIGLPALFGGIPLLLKLAPTLAVLAVLVGIQIGSSSAAPQQDHLQQALVVMAGIIALGSFVIHQWLKYQRQSLRYQLEINEAIYFRNLNNNAGIFDAIIGAAEEQESKEALLAYFFLLADPMEQDALDAKIETWLPEKFHVEIDFEVEDGVAKLERLGLLTRSGERLSVVAVGEGLIRLDRRWDEFFRFNAPAAPEARIALR